MDTLRFNPYPGLRPFDEDHSEYFKGRGRHVEQIIRNLKGERFVSIIGVSGCGKSSLIFAGLIPKLHEGQLLPIPQRAWKTIVMTPYDAPWRRLAEALEEKGIPFGDPDAATARPPTALLNAVQRALQQSDFTGTDDGSFTKPSGQAFALLLVVDQFEEIFHSHDGGVPPDASDFVRTLLLAAGQDTVPIYIVLAMRSDFIGDCARFRDLPEKIDRTQFLIPRMNREELAAAIVEPAKDEGVEIHPDLVERLVQDTGDDPDRLPLLQHVLSRLWEQSVHNGLGEATNELQAETLITLSDYEAVGHITPLSAPDNSSIATVEGKPEVFLSALDQHAESIYSSLAPKGDARRQYAKWLFRSLTQREIGQRNTRVKKSLRECSRIVFAPTGAAADWQPSELQMNELAGVIDVFRASGCWFLRPYTTTKTVLDPDKDLVDITHESLITSWSRLKKWVDLEYEDAREYQWITQAAEKWKNREGGFLSPKDLARFHEWRDKIRLNHAWTLRYGGNLEVVSDYTAAWQKQIDEDSTQKAREAAHKSWLKIGVTITVCAGLVASLFFWRQNVISRRLAESEIVRGYTESIRSNAIFGLSRQDEDALWRLAGTPEKQQSVRTTVLARLYGDSGEGNFNKLELGYLQNSEPQLQRAAAGIGATARDFHDTQALLLADRLVTLAKNTSAPDMLGLIASTWSKLGKFQPSDKNPSADLAARLVTVMNGQSDPDILRSLAFVLESLGEQMAGNKQPLTDGAVRLVTVMEEQSDPYILYTLSSGLASLGKFMAGNKQPLADGAARLVTAMEGQSDSYILHTLSSGLASLGEFMAGNKQPLANGAARLVAVMESQSDPEILNSLASDLASLSGHMTGEKRSLADGATRLVTVMKEQSDPKALESLTSALALMGEHMTGEKRSLADGAARLVRVMRMQSDPKAICSLASDLASLGEHLSDDKQTLEDGAARLVTVMKDQSDPKTIESLASGLALLGKHMAGNKQPLSDGAAWLVTVMKNQSDPKTIESLASGLALLGKHMAGTKQPLSDGAAWLVTVMKDQSDPKAIEPIASGLALLGKHMAGAKVPLADGAARLVSVISKESDLRNFVSLASSLSGLTEQLDGTSLLTSELLDRISLLANRLASEASKASGNSNAQIEPQFKAESAQQGDSKLKQEPFKSNGKVASILVRLGERPLSEKATQVFVMIDFLRAIQDSQMNLSKSVQIDTFGHWAAKWNRKPELKFGIATLLSSGALDSRRLNISDRGLGSFEEMINGLDKDELVELLKYPLCTDVAEQVVLEALENKTGAKFGGDIWELVKQAPQLHLAVEKPPERPDGEKIVKNLEVEYEKLKPSLPRID